MPAIRFNRIGAASQDFANVGQVRQSRCGEHFRYLREGRIFNLEIDPPLPGSSPGPRYRIEHFWLCELCAKSLTVVYEQGLVITKCRHRELPQGEPEPEPKAKLASSGI